MPKDISSIRMERMNELMSLLSDGRGYTKSELMARFEYASARTLERDLEFLRYRFNADIRNEPPNHRYKCYDCGQFMLRTVLTRDEVTALAAGLKMAGHFLPHLTDGAQNAWTKIAGLMPKELMELGQELSEATTLSLPVSALSPKILEQVIQAIRNKKAIDIQYASPYQNNETKQRTISPWGIYFQSHAWYLWAASDKHPQGATYRISRIQNCTQSQTEYIIQSQGRSTKEYAQTAWFAKPGELKYDIKLHIKMPLASIVTETVWHPTQKIETQPDGSIIYSARVPDLEEVARWTMSCAPWAEAIEPCELKDRVKQLCRSFEE